jgi:hypothetical protein
MYDKKLWYSTPSTYKHLIPAFSLPPYQQLMTASLQRQLVFRISTQPKHLFGGRLFLQLIKEDLIPLI